MSATLTAPARSTAVTPDPVRTGAGHRWLAVTRVVVGFIFLWAFLDKLFGLGYSTPSARSVLNGGSPTRGFLSHVNVGPLQGVFTSIAGSPVVDVLFMLSLLAIGVAMIVGAGLRIAAISNAVLMLGMWAAEWPMATRAGDGTPTGSTNPFVDYHLAYALIGIVFAYFAVASTYGLGAWWSRRAIVRRFPILL
jgi:thiosulfate dehydrogenase [quinone] large subunit